MRLCHFATKFTFQYPVMSQATQVFNGPRSMRTLAGGLEKLDELQPNLGDRPISIKTLPMRLPTGELTAIVALIGPETSDDARWAIALPSSAQFVATTTLGAPQRCDIALLNDATVDIRGNVSLTHDVHLHNVELVPTTPPRDLTMRQERILYLTIFFLKARARCFRPVDPSLPDVVALDYSTLSAVKLPSLKKLEWQIKEVMPDTSRQEITNALAVAGMRRPRSGRHANRSALTSAP
jgi:hypothetical protein